MLLVQKHLKIILAVLSFLALSTLALFLGRRSGSAGGLIPPPPDLGNELKAISAEAEVQKLQAQLGAEKAREHVELTYAEHLRNLSAVDSIQALELKNNPAALAGFLVRAGGAK